MFICTTIFNPNVESIIGAVASILHNQMLEDIGQGKITPEKSDLFFFSEEKYFQEKSEAFDLQDINLCRETQPFRPFVIS
jgi:hypothetical protein